MVHALTSFDISSSAEEAFDFLSDLENDEKWVANWTSRRTSEGRGLGATYARSYKFPLGRTVESVVVVTAYDRPRRFAFESRISSGTAFIEYRLEPSGAGVRVTKEESLRHGGLLGWLNSLFAFAFRWEARKLMARLKHAIEAQRPGGQ